MGREKRAVVAGSGFSFRTPLLPLDELAALADGLTGDLEQDCARVRERLRSIIDRPEVEEALFVASPDLFESLEHWRAQPETERGQRAERSLVRYVSRMTCRPTPFGLFSGISVGTIAPTTRLEVVPLSRYDRHTRLDNDYLFALCEQLGKDLVVRSALLYRPNTSLYEAAGRLRYAEARVRDKDRAYHLVDVEPTDYLRATLERASHGATRQDLADALVAGDPEVTIEEAVEFIDALIDGQILVSHLTPAVTGREPIFGIIDVLSTVTGAGLAEPLAAAQRQIEAIDAAGMGQPRDRYVDVARTLGQLPTEVELARLFQVDLVKPSPQATLGERVVREIERAIGLLHRTGGPAIDESLRRFREQFSTRYETREVPLVIALDEDSGIGFDASTAPGVDASPLLDGLAFPARAGGAGQARWGQRESLLLRLLAEALAQGRTEIELTEKDLDRMGSEPIAPLPDAFSVMATLIADSAEGVDQGRFQLLFDGGFGPSGARLLGRFCHASPQLTELVLEHVRAEEALAPDAAFAEIVHLSEGRIGNILCRPVLRGHEIPFLGLSGASPAQQIPINDLWVSVQGDRIVLRSHRLGCEVLPRLSTAHNFSMRSLGIYRFLCSLQSQGVGSVGFGWGTLGEAPFLPRVRCGRVVFERARWLLGRKDLEPLATAAKATGATGRSKVMAAAQALRVRCKLPRWVLIADADNELPIDFENPLSVDSAVQLIKSRPSVTLYELFPGPGELCASGPEGRFVHELVVPFVREREPARHRRSPDVGAIRRRLAPGSDWLYAKFYGGSAASDDVLRELVGPVSRTAIESGAADRWFFIRYGDPDWHLRVRFRGDPARLRREVLPQLEQGAGDLEKRGLIWRFQLDTYERELERYAGAGGMDLAEELFWIDSDAALGIVELLEGDEGSDARWRLAVRGTDQLLDDLGLDLPAKHGAISAQREGFHREHGVDTGFQKQLGVKYRKLGAELTALLERDPAADADSPLSPGFDLLAQRSQRLAPVAERLRERASTGALTSEIPDLALSFVHMHINRMLRSAQRPHEVVIYDLLKRYYESRIARAKKTAKP